MIAKLADKIINSMLIPWILLLIEVGLVGYTAYMYADKGKIGMFIAFIICFVAYVWCGIMLIKCMRLDKEIKKIGGNIARLKEGIDFYASYKLCDDNEGEEWKAKEKGGE